MSQKLPIAVLLRGVLERCFAAERIDRLFEQHAQRQYTQQMLFSTTCDLLLQVVLRVEPSLYAAYREQEADLGVSVATLYDKVKGVEVGVSAALVRETAHDLVAIRDALGVSQAEWLPGYRVRVLDGNCLAGTKKRLAVQRGQSGAAFEVLLAAIDSAQAEPVSSTLSTYYLAHQIAATFLTLLTLTEPEEWRFIGALSPAEFAGWLRDTAAHVDPRKYRKTSRGPKKPSPKKSHDPKRPHFSTQRLLDGKTKGTP